MAQRVNFNEQSKHIIYNQHSTVASTLQQEQIYYKLHAYRNLQQADIPTEKL